MLSKADRKSILMDCEISSALAGPLLFPNRFSSSFDPIHKPMFDIIDKRPGDPGYSPYKLIIAPRGIGKTSVATLLVASLGAILHRYSYIVVVGYNADDAMEKTESLKAELERNPMIRDLFGEIKLKDHWSKKEFILEIAGRQIKIHPRGSGQPIRGRLFMDDRPGLVIVDDLEKTKETESEDQRTDKKNWFYADVLNCINPRLKHIAGEPAPWEFLVVGTILHQDSLLINLHKSKAWDSVLLEICNDNFVSNAPNFMNDAECKAKYEMFRNDDQVHTWYNEYRNNPVPTGKDAAFQPEFYQYYNEGELKLNLDPNVESVVIIDPSRTANYRSAPTGIIGLGLDMKKNRIYVRDLRSERYYPEEMYQATADMIRQLEARVLAVEVTGLHEFIVHPLKTFLSNLGIHVEFVELNARAGRDEKGKTARVRTLVPFYRERMIWHNDVNAVKLEQQLAAFPKARDWSLMDPFGYVVELLEKGERYLSFKGTADMMTREDIERQYDELEKLYVSQGDLEYKPTALDNW